MKKKTTRGDRRRARHKAAIAAPVETGDNLRKDDGKLRFDLIPWEWLEALAEVLGAGARKYTDRGWEAGMDYNRCTAALLRHHTKYLKGEKHDVGPGGVRTHHMAQVAWNALVIMSYDLRGVGKDNLPKYPLALPIVAPHE